MNILIFGLGRSGLAAADYVTKQGNSLFVYDDQMKNTDLDIILRLGGRPLGTTGAASIEDTKLDLCIAAPGVPYTHPKLLALRERGIETIGEVEWVARNTRAKLIAVTATAGKTSVTRWLTDVLVAAGIDAAAGGNIDPALCAIADEHSTLVAELSSFQLERCPTLKPNIAIVLNLGQDHLDRHGSLSQYHGAKQAIMLNQDQQDVFIYNADDPVLRSWAEISKAQTLSFADSKGADAYLDSFEGEAYLFLHNEALMPAKTLQVAGKHQLKNALAVALAASAYGISRTQIIQGLKAFRGVAGRYALAGKIKEISFIEDSIATRSLAVKAALESSTYPIVWIAGGEDKGADFELIKELIKERVSLFVGMGNSADFFIKQVSAYCQTVLCAHEQGKDALRCAVEQGVEHLTKEHAAKGTILFAPLAASFDQFKDYKERARVFREVIEEGQERWMSY